MIHGCLLAARPLDTEAETGLPSPHAQHSLAQLFLRHCQKRQCCQTTLPFVFCDWMGVCEGNHETDIIYEKEIVEIY